MNPRLLLVIAASMASIASVAAAGCGSSDATTTVTDHRMTTMYMPGTGMGGGMGAGGGTGGASSAPAGGPSTAAGDLNFQMGDLFFKPDSATATAGSVKVSVENVGGSLHEWVLAKTNLAPDALPTLPNGEVDEEQLDSPGEIADIAPGEGGKTTLDLAPGKYVFFCNVPGHYAGGMYGALEVKGG